MNTSFSEHDLIVDGARVHYYRGGTPGKPPLVLAHGFTDNGSCWQEMAEDLAAEYDIYMPDALGHGRSERVPANAKVDQPAVLAGVIRGLGLQHPIVGGHSMGAAVSAQLAARFPDIPRALLLEDPPWFSADFPRPQAPTDAENPYQKLIRQIQDEKTPEEVNAMCAAEHPAWSAVTVQRWQESKKQVDLNVFTWQGDFLHSWLDVARQITCPALLITAAPELGGITRRETAQQVREENPNFRVVLIPKAGHCIRYDNFAGYMQAVRTFLAELKN